MGHYDGGLATMMDEIPKLLDPFRFVLIAVGRRMN
jgi:hypothetical protein